MEREALVSGGDAVRAISLDSAQEERRVSLERAGALCASKEHIFCACDSVIAALDRKSLMPRAFFSGGAGISELTISADEERLYALCSDADSVLMLDSVCGKPLLLNRVGVNPRQMVLSGDMLAVAGGESGDIFMLCAKSLSILERLSMPGPVYSVAMHDGSMYALCLTADLKSMLVTVKGGGKRSMILLSGMPGRLLVRKDLLFAATERTLYRVSLDGERIISACAAPGRTSWLAQLNGKMLLLDAYTEGLFCADRAGWKLICLNAAAATIDGA